MHVSQNMVEKMELLHATHSYRDTVLKRAWKYKYVYIIEHPTVTARLY